MSDSRPERPLWQGHQAPEQGSASASATYAEPAAARRRQGPWTAALLVLLIGGLLTAVLLVDDGGTPVRDLGVGDCLVSDDLASASGDVDDLRVVDCAEEHDAEVVARLELGADGGEQPTAGACVESLGAIGTSLATLTSAGLEVRPLQAAAGSEGIVACVVRDEHGEKLTGTVRRTTPS